MADAMGISIERAFLFALMLGLLAQSPEDRVKTLRDTGCFDDADDGELADAVNDLRRRVARELETLQRRADCEYPPA
jgi:hypothetical protein